MTFTAPKQKGPKYDFQINLQCLSNFSMGTILGKGFVQAQVHKELGTFAMKCMHELFCI